MRGDWRCLYLARLIGVQDEIVEGETYEPPRPAELARSSGALDAFLGFLGLDPDLVEAAAAGDDAAVSAPEPTRAEIATFLAGLPDTEKTALLQRAVLDQDPHLGLENVSGHCSIGCGQPDWPLMIDFDYVPRAKTTRPSRSSLATISH